MNNTERLFQVYCSHFPNSGHGLDEKRFKEFVIASYKERNALSSVEIMQAFLDYKNEDGFKAFTFKEAEVKVGEYQNYLHLLELYDNKD